MSDAAMWDHEAITFDEAVDHGLTDPTARRAWEELLHPLPGKWSLRQMNPLRL